MAESTDNPDGPREGAGRRGDGDLLAERRARRAAETGEVALTRRAEAAEATVETLERHVASLQQRVREAEDERIRLAESLELERDAAAERESELRRVKQREYAEQQLRAEAEARLEAAGDAGELERLRERLSGSERGARELSQRLEAMRRELAEAEQSAAAERAAVARGERELQARLAELERRASAAHDGLQAERAARERSEALLETMRQASLRMANVLGEMRGMIAQVALAEPRAVELAQPAGAEIEQRMPGEAPVAGQAAIEPPEPQPAALEEAPLQRQPQVTGPAIEPAPPAAAEQPDGPVKDAAEPQLVRWPRVSPQELSPRPLQAEPEARTLPAPVAEVDEREDAPEPEPEPEFEPTPLAAAPPAQRDAVHQPPQRMQTPESADAERAAEMAQALAAAVERLRARAELAPEEDTQEPAQAAERPTIAGMAEANKHSKSLIARWRNKRKQRRSR